MDAPAEAFDWPELFGHARAFRDRHAPRLIAAGVLTPADVDAFVHLCRTHALLESMDGLVPGADSFREMIQHTNLSKQFQALCKQFGLMPQARKAGKLSLDAPKPKDEFGL
jgi:hypothetical protein